MIAVASLITSIWMTEHRPTWAFYLLPARMVELLAGAALAAAGPAFRAVNAGLRAALGWFGLVGICVAAMTYDVGTVFPGYMTMLPVLATVLVIVAGGTGGSARGPVVVLRHPVALWIGRHSYAIYLWHWPVLVLVEAEYGPLPLPTRLLLVAVAVGLSAASLRLVEDPVRHSPWLARRAARGLVLGGALCATAVLAGAWMRSCRRPARLGRDGGRADARAADDRGRRRPSPRSSPPPRGAERPDREPRRPARGRRRIPRRRQPGGARAGTGADRRAIQPAPVAPRRRCRSRRGLQRRLRRRRAGERSSTPAATAPTDRAFTVVLYGDSHAAQWFPALEAIAEERQFELVVMIKGGCPTAAVSIPTATLARTCPIWRDQAVALIAAEQPELVLVSASAGYPNDDDEWGEGFAATMRRVVPNASNVVVIGDTPEASDEPTDCLSRNLRRADVCASDRDDVVASHPSRRRAGDRRRPRCRPTSTRPTGCAPTRRAR